MSPIQLKPMRLSVENQHCSAVLRRRIPTVSCSKRSMAENDDWSSWSVQSSSDGERCACRKESELVVKWGGLGGGVKTER